MARKPKTDDRVVIQRVPDFVQHAPSPDYSTSEPSECQRTYPLDPLTAEDPCEDCGRDERKHETSPFEPPTAEDLRKMHADAVQRSNPTVVAPDDYERADFVDRVAVGLFCSGWPKATIYSHAATLWELRQKWRREQGL